MCKLASKEVVVELPYIWLKLTHISHEKQVIFIISTMINVKHMNLFVFVEAIHSLDHYNSTENRLCQLIFFFSYFFVLTVKPIFQTTYSS